MMINSQILTIEPAQIFIKKIELIIYLFAFCVPMLLHGQQMLVGPIVNALLFIVARKLSWQKLWPVILLPSLAAIIQGVVVGPWTMFLIYLMPAIWLGNFSLVFIIKKFETTNLIARIALASIFKAALIFVAAWVLVQLNLIPVALLPLMGMGQLLTALVGGGLAEASLQLINRDVK